MVDSTVPQNSGMLDLPDEHDELSVSDNLSNQEAKPASLKLPLNPDMKNSSP